MYSIHAEEKRTGKVAALITSIIATMILLALIYWSIDRASKQNDISSLSQEEIILTDISGMSSPAGGSSSKETKYITVQEHSALTGESPVPEKRQNHTASSELNEALSAFSKSRGTSQTTTGSNSANQSTISPALFNQGNVKLKGRVMVQPPGAVFNLQEEGKVVVAIVVDEKGNVLQAEPGEPGSTTTSAALYLEARKAAMTAKFNPSKEGVHEQRGTITFVFVLK